MCDFYETSVRVSLIFSTLLFFYIVKITAFTHFPGHRRLTYIFWCFLVFVLKVKSPNHVGVRRSKTQGRHKFPHSHRMFDSTMPRDHDVWMREVRG